MRRPVRNTPADRAVLSVQMGSDMQASFHWPDEPAELIAADMSVDSPAPWRSVAIPRFTANFLKPGVIAREVAAVRVPVLLAYGEVDVTPEPLVDAMMFRSTCDLHLAIIPEMAHMHNFADTRRALWQRIENFVALVQSCPTPNRAD
jgi:pimeloyl-ACP methyl ester carboxylesterase